MTSPGQQAWLVSVDMGYGHQRAAFPLRGMACERIITANSDRVVAADEMRQWRRVRAFYEGVSRLSGLPLAGPPLWRAYDRLQRIAGLYPLRDQSRPTANVLYLDWLLRRGFARSVVEYARSRDLPFVSTFFVPALAAAKAGLRRVYCIVTDVDINRIWVARDPAASAVVYLAPTDITCLRLLQYGVPRANVHLTGFPLPEENVQTAPADLRRRIARLDPKHAFRARYGDAVARHLGQGEEAGGPVVVTYAVGGAGAQREIAADILGGLAQDLRSGRFHLNLIAGTRLDVRDDFMRMVRAHGLDGELGRSVRVHCWLDMHSHFAGFNACLRETDILWTKPSEQVFGAALGVPLVLTPSLGAHEVTNRDWILRMGAGFVQEDPRYASQWLAHWLDRGMLAEAAFDGYSKAPRHGTENVRRVVFAEDPSQAGLSW